MTTATAAQNSATFNVDPVHSEAGFQVRHLLTRVRGSFRDVSGTIMFDEQTPTNSTVEFRIQAASIDTGQPDRDKHLRSDDFFAVDRFPELTFVSRSIAPVGANAYIVSGTLTMRGVSRTIDLPATFLGAATDPWGNRKIGFEAEATLNRKDYGLNWNAALETGGFLVGDEVRVSLSVQAAAAPAAAVD